jgi:hypothetical protein
LPEVGYLDEYLRIAFTARKAFSMTHDALLAVDQLIVDDVVRTTVPSRYLN